MNRTVLDPELALWALSTVLLDNLYLTSDHRLDGMDAIATLMSLRRRHYQHMDFVSVCQGFYALQSHARKFFKKLFDLICDIIGEPEINKTVFPDMFSKAIRRHSSFVHMFSRPEVREIPFLQSLVLYKYPGQSRLKKNTAIEKSVSTEVKTAPNTPQTSKGFPYKVHRHGSCTCYPNSARMARADPRLLFPEGRLPGISPQRLALCPVPFSVWVRRSLSDDILPLRPAKLDWTGSIVVRGSEIRKQKRKVRESVGKWGF